MRIEWTEETPPWVQWALGEVGRGVMELRKGDHPRIVGYHAQTSLGPKPDEVPWCSSALCAAFERTGVQSTKDARAVSWRRWGVPCGLVDGAVCYFPPSDPDAGGTGHVGLFFAGKLLGGNQRNRWSLAGRNFSGVAAVRWPLEYANLAPKLPRCRVDLNLRSGPGTGFRTVTDTPMPAGTRLLVVGDKQGDWGRVIAELAHGPTQGWAHLGYLAEP